MTIEKLLENSKIIYLALLLISFISVLIMFLARLWLKGILNLLFLTFSYSMVWFLKYGSMPLFVVSTSGSSGTYLNCLFSSTTSPGARLPIACLYCSEVTMKLYVAWERLFIDSE